MSTSVFQFATLIPQVVVLIVGIVLFAVRRRRIGSPATFAIIGFVLHVVAYALTASSTLLLSEISGSRTTFLITLNSVVTVIRLVGYVLVIIAIVRFARDRIGVPPPPPGFGPYPPQGPGFDAYAPAPGGGQYPPQAPMSPPQAHQGQERGELFRSAVGELTEMGRSGALSQNGRWNPRVRELGQLLDRSGGIYAMKEAHMQFARTFPHLGRELDVAWIGIGNWQG